MKKIFILILLMNTIYAADTKTIVYLVSDIKIPFWNIMAKGIKTKAMELGYEVQIYSADNINANELKNTFQAIDSNIDGLIVSPINSSSASTILKLAKKSNIPSVISDIGADRGDYVSFISSNNFQGAYNIGKILANKMKDLNIDTDGTVGIISIPQKRSNGKARTDGFLKAMNEADIKIAGLLQQENFSYKETYDHSMTLITNNSNLKALWLQGSDKYKGALDAIKDSGKKDKILLVCFDAEPEFIDMIQEGKLVGTAMQQPYLMGTKAVEALVNHLDGKKVLKEQQLEVLAISKENIKSKLPVIKRNVLGIEE